MEMAWSVGVFDSVSKSCGVEVTGSIEARLG
jgi:hypothetical protein